MKITSLKYISPLFTLIFSQFIYSQINLETNCDIPNSYLVGEYHIEDNVANVGPANSTSNFQSGTYQVTANGNIRTFQISLLPGFTPNDFTVELTLDCGIIQMTDINTNISCTGDPLIFGTTDNTNATTYDLSDDNTFIINYTEDPLGTCGGPYLSSFTMTKVCNAPESISFSNVTSNTIDMNWMDPNDTLNNNSSYTIEYGIQGFALGNGQTINNISGDTHTVNNLQANALYDFYIWTACSETNTSEVLGPFEYGTFANPVFEIAPNGVTCLCPNANIGDSGTVTINNEQKTFTKRNRSQLMELINNDINDPEIALTCTTYIQDMSYLFQDKTSFNQDISSWDVSNVTNMQRIFHEARIFNQNIEYWKVGNVTNMEGMFYNAFNFNQNLNLWNVENVTDMSYMFYNDYGSEYPNPSFNMNIGNWNVSNVTNMSHMFHGALLFNQPIGNWNVSNVTDTSYMFSYCFDFDQNITQWNVSNVTTMEGMFYNAFDFNQSIGIWDVSSVTNMSYMFFSFYSTLPMLFNQNINNWDVSNVTNMSYMFQDAENFNQPLNNWDVSNVTNMSYMFLSCNTFNQPLNNWDVSSVTTMHSMFQGTSAFNQPLDNWDVSNVISLFGMFSYSAFNQNINDWNVSNVTRFDDMFFRNYNYNQPLNNWDVSSAINTKAMFYDAESFNQPLDNWNFNNLNICSDMFHNALAFNQNINTWNMSNVAVMKSMFWGAVDFNQPLDNWDVSHVSDMRFLFKNASSFNQDITNWCVENLPNEPLDFSLNSPLQNDFKPNWGAACTLSLSENELNLFKLYPNPTKNKVYVEVNTIDVDLEINILDLSGKIIHSQNIDALTTEIDLEFLSSGVYFIKITSQTNQQIERLIKE